jgi:hypothetical protein
MILTPVEIAQAAAFITECTLETGMLSCLAIARTTKPWCFELHHFGLPPLQRARSAEMDTALASRLRCPRLRALRSLPRSKSATAIADLELHTLLLERHSPKPIVRQFIFPSACVLC